MSEQQTLSYSEHHVESDAVPSADHNEAELMLNHTSMVDKIIAREELDQQIEAFLNSGGKISCIGADVMADPPRKPENKYGSHPI